MNTALTFVWRMTALHTIAYFVAGIFALTVMNYREAFGAGILSAIMQPVDSPVVALGPALQIVRGLIIAAVLLPLKESFISKNGWLTLAVLIFGLSYLTTIGPTFGSFEGYIYTKLPIEYHLLGIPEAVIYVFLLTYLMGLWYKHPGSTWNYVSAAVLVLIVTMSLLGYAAATGMLRS